MRRRGVRTAEGELGLELLNLDDGDPEDRHVHTLGEASDDAHHGVQCEPVAHMGPAAVPQKTWRLDGARADDDILEVDGHGFTARPTPRAATARDRGEGFVDASSGQNACASRHGTRHQRLAHRASLSHLVPAGVAPES